MTTRAGQIRDRNGADCKAKWRALIGPLQSCGFRRLTPRCRCWREQDELILNRAPRCAGHRDGFFRAL